MNQSASTEFFPFSGPQEPVVGLEAEQGFMSVLLSSRRLLVFVFMTVVFAGASRSVTDPDFWWHLKTGQFLLETRHIPYTDIFSSMRFGSEWVTHEWLSEVFIYAVFRTLGYGGLILAFSAIITAAVWISYQRIKQRVGHPYVSGFVLLLGSLAAAPTWGVRPQMFSFLFASIFIGTLLDYARDEKKRRLWWLAPLMVLWVNLHAGYALGLVLILLTIVGLLLEEFLSSGWSYASINRRLRPLCLVGILCVVAVLCNPNGARMFTYPLETLRSHAMMKYIEEWLSPNFHELMFLPLGLLLIATFGAMALSNKRPRLTELLLLLVTAWASLRSARNAPFFVLVAMPLLAEHAWALITPQRWGQWLTAPEKRETGVNDRSKMVLNVLVLVAVPLIFAGVRVHRSVAEQLVVEAKGFPTAAVEFIRTHKPPQPIYNEYGWGGYLIWKLYPEYRVYIDGRADVYGDEFMEEFLSAHAGLTKWRESLDKYAVRSVLIKPDTGLASLLRQEQGWEKVFEDDQAVIFVKK